MAGRRHTFGAAGPFSDWMMEHSSVPKGFPACLRVSPKSSRRFLACAECRGCRKQVPWFQVLNPDRCEWQKGNASMPPWGST
jgi:hypothetical protein